MIFEYRLGRWVCVRFGRERRGRRERKKLQLRGSETRSHLKAIGANRNHLQDAAKKINKQQRNLRVSESLS